MTSITEEDTRFKLAEIINQVNLSELDELAKEELRNELITAFNKMNNPQLRQNKDVISIFEDKSLKDNTFINYIHFIIEDDGNWKIQIGKKTTGLEHGMIAGVTKEVVYYIYNHQLSGDAVTKRFVENCGEQKVLVHTETMIFENGKWEFEISHERDYFNDTINHEIIPIRNTVLRVNSDHPRRRI